MHGFFRPGPSLFAIGILAHTLFCGLPLRGQTAIQMRVWLADKGSPDRVLTPSDPDYQRARDLISDRALARRAKVLPEDSLVTTRDLPVYAPYAQEVESVGVRVRQRSRWFNTLLVEGDSADRAGIAELAFVDSVQELGSFQVQGIGRAEHPDFSEKMAAASAEPLALNAVGCIVERYGQSESQLIRTGVDHAHAIGIAGSGVLVGILDAGFDWRGHTTLKNARVVAEYDFVNSDAVTSDQPGQTEARFHGTLVMSVIGGYAPDTLVGVAPQVSFALAKTEDVATETPLEEDNYVAGLEWLEGLGVDVTNTSLGYTTFDPPYYSHGDGDLNGSTAFASRGVNHAARLGVLSIISAGNEFRGFRRVGVPGEADSAIAVAALDSAGNAAPFSSQGSGNPERIKPDIAAPGVRIFGANADSPLEIIPVQGTSLAAPLVTGAAALLYSARPSLTPSEVRGLLLSTASNHSKPDTTIGAGNVQVDMALKLLGQEYGFAGRPLLLAEDHSIFVYQWVVADPAQGIDDVDPGVLQLGRSAEVRNLRNGASIMLSGMQPETGLNRWYSAQGADQLQLVDGDTILVSTSLSGGINAESTIVYGVEGIENSSTLCRPSSGSGEVALLVHPNPAGGIAAAEFLLTRDERVSLRLFNTVGEEVLSILDETPLDEGFHTLVTDLGRLPGGAYYYLLEVDHEVYSWPIVIVR